jgi:hypothetical protein
MDRRDFYEGRCTRGRQYVCAMVRETMPTYQAIVATRNDQGQLASMQNKLVRNALERLRLSIKEFLDELPPSMDAAYAAAISPVDANPPRVFLPTRPSLLNAGDSARIFIVSPGQTAVPEIKLYSRRLGDPQWKSVAAHAGRFVYSAQLGPFQASGRNHRILRGRFRQPSSDVGSAASAGQHLHAECP